MPSSDKIGLSSGLSAAVIGGGPAGLIAAETLAQAGVTVTIYDRMPSLGRKFLLAGRGGLNLTHSEDLPAFLSRYGDAAPLLRQAIESFPPTDLRAWAENLGQATFVGSSGRVFPNSFKTSPLLRAWLRRLSDLKVVFAPRHDWTGWNEKGELCFRNAGRDVVVVGHDVTVLALGGASWPKLGSDASWTNILEARGISIAPLRPSNCGFIVNWSEKFRGFEGTPLKTIAISFNGQTVRGECIVTREGLEGGAIYALSAKLRDAINAPGHATIHIDLNPDVAAAKLAEKFKAPRGKQSLANVLRKAAKLSPVETALLHEAALSFGKPLSSLKLDDLASLIKSVPVRLTGVQPIATAISIAGGIAFDTLDQNFMLTKIPGVFAAGEMLDWEAPTGGYLLQASFATGVAAARGALAFLKSKTD
ncbi:MAG TPA: TIGR03862 family flavoprotein [Pseudolabrys sp.]|nr:TIGR03862 family flavoprotein [Pseudolabrys sp.]